jgi:Trypsin-co-occurring domain 1
VRERGRLTERLQGVAEAAEEVAGSLRSRLAPDEVSLEFGLKASAEANWLFFAESGIPDWRYDAAAGFIEIDFRHSGGTIVINY